MIFFEKLDQEDPMTLAFEVMDDESQERNSFEFQHTYHSMERCSSRGLTPEKIMAVLTYGDCLSKQGLEYIFMTKQTSQHLPDHLKYLADKLENIAVVMSSNGVMITAYHSKNVKKHLKMKTKTLSKPRC